MAVNINNGVATSANASGTTITFSYSCNSNANRLLLVSTRGSSAVNSGTYAGASLTLHRTYNNMKVWRRVAPATGANNLSFVMASGYSYLVINAANFWDVDQTTPTNTEVVASGTGTAPSTGSVTCPTNGAVFGMLQTDYVVGGTPWTATNGNTLTQSHRNSAIGYMSAGAYRFNTGVSSWSGPSASIGYDIVAVPINPVAAASAAMVPKRGGPGFKNLYLM